MRVTNFNILNNHLVYEVSRDLERVAKALIATMSFGWSAGDIVSAAKLLYKIGVALKESGGASTEYQDISSTLETIIRTLEHLNALQAKAPGLDTHLVS